MNFIVIDAWLHRDGNYGHTSREGKASECIKVPQRWLRWDSSVVHSHSPQPPAVMWNYCSMLFIKTDTFSGVLQLATLKGQMFLLVMRKNFLLFFSTVLSEDLCCFSDLLLSCLHSQIRPGFAFEEFRQSSAPQSSPN